MVDEWELNRRREFPPEVLPFLREHGFFGLVIPREYGGRAFSALGCSAVFGKLTSRSLALSSIVLIPNSVGPAELIAAYGTEDQKERYLRPLASGAEIPCFALTEPHAGSDAAAMRSQGVVFRSADGRLSIRLDFEKRYITLAPVATLIGLAVKLIRRLFDESVGCLMCSLARGHAGMRPRWPRDPGVRSTVSLCAGLWAGVWRG
jgi:acyl-CoA dehydrogenase